MRKGSVEESKKAYIKYKLKPITDKLFLAEVEDTEYDLHYTVVIYCVSDKLCYELSPN